VAEEVKGVGYAAQNVQKWCQNGQFPELIDLKDVKNSDFLYLKVLNKL
jgi:hypothetical protein